MSDEPELNNKGYPKILDKVLEITGTTYDDIEQMKQQEQREFSTWVQITNLRKKFERGEMPLSDYEEIGLKILGGRHD